MNSLNHSLVSQALGGVLLAAAFFACGSAGETDAEKPQQTKTELVGTDTLIGVCFQYSIYRRSNGTYYSPTWPGPGPVLVGSTGVGPGATVTGTNDADLIWGGPGYDRIFGNGGDDYICGGDGDDEIHGGKGDDRINGNAGIDTIYGEIGNDIIYGGKDSDNLLGGPGSDHLYGDAGSDWLYGGDTPAGDPDADYCDGGADDDSSALCENLTSVEIYCINQACKATQCNGSVCTPTP